MATETGTVDHQLTCPICFEDPEMQSARLPACNHTFCLECIAQWAETCEEPRCPLCSKGFDSAILHDGDEKKFEIGTTRRPSSTLGLIGLDSSFFLQDVERLLDRMQAVLQGSFGCVARFRLQITLDRLQRHKRNLQQGIVYEPAVLLWELASFNNVIAQVQSQPTQTSHAAGGIGRGRLYGADDSDQTPSDESESDIAVQISL